MAPLKKATVSLLAAMTGSLVQAETSDFSFGSGSPFGGSTVVAGIQVVLATTNTEPFGLTSFRDLIDESVAQLDFSFDALVSDFSLSVSRVHPDEFLADFSLGEPDVLSGTLAFVDGRVTTTGVDDFGFGTLTWSAINVSQLSLSIGNLPNPQPAAGAISVDSFSITPVPAPQTAVLLLLGLSSLLWHQRAKVRAASDA